MLLLSLSLQRLILNTCEEFEISTKHVSKLINLKHLEITDAKVLEEKKTTSGFRKLDMGERYKGEHFSNWLSPLSNIVDITLHNCEGLKLKYLPPMECLRFLRSVRLSHLPELEYIYYEEPFLSETFFLSLERLFLCENNKLKGWWRMNDVVNEDNHNCSQSHNLSLPPFPPRLSFLTIDECPMLTRVPTFPNLDKRLQFRSSNMETWEATINMISSKCLIEFPPLSKLKYLQLENVDLDMKKFPENWVQNLTSLELLEVVNFSDKKIQDIGTWFLEDFNYLPSLQKIEFWKCSELKALPDWILNLSSLQHITIYYCEIIAYLPKECLVLPNYRP